MHNCKENPAWVAALLALPITVIDDQGARVAKVEYSKDQIQYTATATPQVLQPFCLTLSAGEVVTIRWHHGDSSPSVRVRAA